MQINNPFQMNDWEIKKFLTVVLAIQLAVWGVIGLDAIGLHIPVIRELIGFVYLLFIPGVIILRILKLHKLGNIETLLYSVGLSIATLMFTGLFMNTVYPLFGISGPISTTPLIITISAVVLILCVISYVRDKDFSAPNYIDIKEVLSPPALFLCLIPFLSIFGTYLVNFYQNNILLMFLIVIIASIVLLIGFNKFIPKNLYPLAVFVIALSLLFHRSLISMYISGFDIHHEYYLSNLVIMNGIWDSTISVGYNTMLSVVMLPPIISNICDISLTWVSKIIYPLLFSLVPLGLYRIFQKQTDDKIAFLSVFFFMSLSQFHTGMPVILRQQIATLFIALLVFLIIDKKMSRVNRAFLFIVFGASLVVSHYALAYIYMFYIIFVWLILLLIGNPQMQKLKNNFYSKFSRYKREKLSGNPHALKTGDRAISFAFVLLFIVFALTWYMYVSGSLVFDNVAKLGYRITTGFVTEFLNPETTEGLSLLLAELKPGLLYLIYVIILYLNQGLIVIGILALLLKYREMKFEKEYAVFSILSLAILFAGVLIPFLTRSINIGRLYIIALIFLAPFCVIGAITIFRMISRVVKISWTNKSLRMSLMVLSVYFVVSFLYGTGFVWEVGQQNWTPVVLNYESIKLYGSPEKKAALYSAFTPEPDVFSAKWISVHRDPKTKIYATYSDVRVHPLLSYGMIPIEDVRMLYGKTTITPEDSYVYLQYVNVVEGIATEFYSAIPFGETALSTYHISKVSHLYQGKNKIYSNGGSEIYK